MRAHHLFLSPHPDDAVLSCGGLIYDLSQRGERVSVWTLMAQDAPTTMRGKPYLQSLHQRWGLGDNPYALRRAEDEAACKTLGVETVAFGVWHDAIYRVGADGRFLYTNDDALFADVQPDDPLLDARLDTGAWPDVTHLYIPLAVGHHVDHQVVNRAAQLSDWPRLQWHFYEDYPYSATSPEVFFSHGGSQSRPYGMDAIQQALDRVPRNLMQSIQKMSSEAIVAKIRAIALYQSQMSTFWPSRDAMAESVQDYHQQIGSRAGFPYAESYWVLPDNIRDETISGATTHE